MVGDFLMSQSNAVRAFPCSALRWFHVPAITICDLTSRTSQHSRCEEGGDANGRRCWGWDAPRRCCDLVRWSWDDPARYARTGSWSQQDLPAAANSMLILTRLKALVVRGPTLRFGSKLPPCCFLLYGDIRTRRWRCTQGFFLRKIYINNKKL